MDKVKHIEHVIRESLKIRGEIPLNKIPLTGRGVTPLSRMVHAWFYCYDAISSIYHIDWLEKTDKKFPSVCVSFALAREREKLKQLMEQIPSVEEMRSEGLKELYSVELIKIVD